LYAPSLVLTSLGTVEATPLVFWKEHKNEYPILASLARDILTTPASGSGVERLFNSARDICHYRRGSLKPQTIKELMLFLCTTKFDLPSEQLALIDEYHEHYYAAFVFDPIGNNVEVVRSNSLEALYLLTHLDVPG
jgi:hypothetical protein